MVQRGGQCNGRENDHVTKGGQFNGGGMVMLENG